MELRRGTPWVLYLLTWLSVGGAALVLMSSVSADQAAAPPPCHGIGFGCSLDAKETTAIALIVVGIPYLVLLATVLGLLELIGPRGTLLRSAIAGIGYVLPLVFATIIVFQT